MDSSPALAGAELNDLVSSYFVSRPLRREGGAPSRLGQALERALTAASLGQAWEWIVPVMEDAVGRGGAAASAAAAAAFFPRGIETLSSLSSSSAARPLRAVVSLVSSVAERFPEAAAAAISDCVAAVRRSSGGQAFFLLSALNTLAAAAAASSAAAGKRASALHPVKRERRGHNKDLALSSLRCLAEDCEWAPAEFPPLTRVMVAAALGRASAVCGVGSSAD